MDDLRSALGAFDAGAPLDAAPEPWDYLPTPAQRDGPPWAMAEMIAVEPSLSDRVARRVMADGSAHALAAAIRETTYGGGPVLITGCGTSEHASLGTAALLRDGWRRAGLPGWGPVSAQALELSLDPPADGLVIGCSHEGGTAATIAAMHAARARGTRTAAITGSAEAPISAAADIVLVTLEMDRSWCHTVGYVSPMVAAAVTSELLAGETPRPEAYATRLAEGIEAAHAVRPDGTCPDAQIGALIGSADHLLVVGSGTDRITARELVLKVEEAAWVPAATRDLETILHGHLPATGSRTALVLVLLERDGLAARVGRARQMLAAAAIIGIRPAAILGAEAAALIPETLTPGGRIVVSEAPAMGAAAAALFGGAGPLQLVTLEVAAARGTNPDPIRRDDPVYLRAAAVADAPDA